VQTSKQPGFRKSLDALAKLLTAPSKRLIGKSPKSASSAAFASVVVRIRLHPEAEEELFQGAARYDADRPGLGDEFVEHVQRWFDVILGSPNTWPSWPKSPDDLVPAVRRLVLDRFPYIVGYQTFPDHVLVLTVAHAKREPFYCVHRARQ